MTNVVPNHSQSIEAVIYLPGISADLVDQSAEGIARRLKRALDQRAATRSARFVLGEKKLQPYGETYQCEVQEVLRKEGESVSGRLDVYILPYLDSLLSSFKQRSVPGKMMSLLAVLLRNLPRLRFLLVKKRLAKVKSALNVWWAGFIVGILGIYFIILLGSAISLFLSALTNWVQQTWFPLALRPYLDGILNYSSLLIAMLASLYLAIRTIVPERWRDMAVDGAIGYTSLLRYMSSGVGRSVVTNHLPALLEHLQNDGKIYRRVHVVGFSFGSIVALDSIYTPEPPAPAITGIHTLLTIGCPYDVFATFWPNHFGGRQSPDDTPDKWLNVTIETDPLASKFQYLDKESAGIEFLSPSHERRSPDRTIYSSEWGHVPIESSWWAALIGSLFHHTQYWDSKNIDSKTCFDALVGMMFENGALLA